MYKPWICLSLLFVFACGRSELSTPSAEAPLELRVHPDYQGTALVTAEPSLKIRTQATAASPLLQTEEGPVKLLVGEGVKIRAVKKDAASGLEFADIGFGWADTRYLKKSSTCTRGFQGPFSYAYDDRFTNSILSLIGFTEGTGNCYNYMVGYKTFTSYTEHPNQCQTFGNNCSTAAGRYQFLKKTWDIIKEKKSIASFGPINQDQGAIYLIENRGFDNYKARLNVAQFRAGIELISWEWASMPPGRYGQPIRQMDAIWQKYKEWTHPDITNKP